MIVLSFKQVALNFAVPDVFKDEAKACDYVYETTQLLQIFSEMVHMFVNKLTNWCSFIALFSEWGYYLKMIHCTVQG